jgi:hypothetical protein
VAGLTLRRSRRTLHDALDHHGRDAREHGLGLRGRQYVDDRVRPLRLLLGLRVAPAEDIPKLTRLLMQITGRRRTRRCQRCYGRRRVQPQAICDRLQIG